ncbi:MAG: hypothetical protein OEM77_05685 [Nitrosopumilus sp.]|nr:hypothetical protein [Nitrosopumilus sp.]MDH3735427.1 hypothetical protein [Nitrosopumilus sp.]MDH3823272.1 hypothetical protein [Nitrosopumilus sp.]MDH3832539.1 hypothetical protein [Nitrosopumilus sp.]
MSYIDDKITKENFFDKIYRKSRSESARHNAETALRNLEIFCQHIYQKEMDQVIDDLISVNNSRKTFVFFQKFVNFLQEDHLEILYNPSQKGAKRKPFEAKMPSSIKGYISKARKYAKMRGLPIDIEDFNDNVSLPTIEEEIDPESFTHEEIRWVCNRASESRRLLYMTMNDSGARDGELCQVMKRDIDFDEDPVEIHLPYKMYLM